MINVICVKWGTKYKAADVNRLEQMVKQYLPHEHLFFCYTDDPKDVECNIIPIETNLEIYWNKMALFQKDFLQGTNIYLDLDIILQGDISFLLDYVEPGKIALIKCFWKKGRVGDGTDLDPRKRWDMDINSSVMVWEGNTCSDIWNSFHDNEDLLMFEYYGVCRYLYHKHFDRLKFFDRGLIYSRLHGYDEDNTQYRKRVVNLIKTELLPFDELELFDIPDYKICILNGPTEKWMYDLTRLNLLPSSPKTRGWG